MCALFSDGYSGDWRIQDLPKEGTKCKVPLDPWRFRDPVRIKADLFISEAELDSSGAQRESSEDIRFALSDLREGHGPIDQLQVEKKS